MNFNQGYRPYSPYRRAIAMAIDLERTHDQLAILLGHSVPIADRITPHPGQRARKERLNLPRPLTLDVLNEMSARRMAAIEELHAQIAPTLGRTSGLIDDIVEEMRVRTGAEENHRGERRGPSRQIAQEDRMSSEEILRRDILRAADAPPPPVGQPMQTVAPDEGSDRVSFSIDLMTEGLLNHHGVDRDALYAELLGHREKLPKQHASRDFTSPALRSNTARPLLSLGRAFPPAMFRLRGLSLDVERITMPIDPRRNDYASWTYRGSAGARDIEAPRLSREDGMNGYDLFDMPRRALRDVLMDARFHDAIVIEQTDRHGAGTASQTTVIRLRRGYTHLDPPGGAAGRFPVRRPSDVRQPRQRFDEPHLIHAALVNRLLSERGRTGRHRLLPRTDGGVTLALDHDSSRSLVHRYEVKADTLADGEAAIAARIDNILLALRDWTSKNATAGVPAPGRDTIRGNAPAPTAIGNDQAAGHEKNEAGGAGTDGDAAPAPVATPAETVAACWGDDAADAYGRSERIDDLLRDLLAAGGPDDPEDVELLHLEKLTCIKRMRIAPDLLYRAERFDRVMGRPTHAIGTVEVERRLTPATIEALRDGTIGMLVPKWPNFARSQVRKVSQHEGMVVITIRMPLADRA